MSVPSLPVGRIIRTRPGPVPRNPASEYSALLVEVRGRGLLGRSRGFYSAFFVALAMLLGALGVAFVLLGDSWFQLVVAAVLAIVLTQFAFLAHEASHRAIFTSGRANDRLGRILCDAVVGISYSWWMNKHSRHHTHPNTIGRDPDIDPDFVVFRAEDAQKITGIAALITRRQGFYFFPLLLLEGLNLHQHALRTVFGPGKVDQRWLEISLLTLRLGGYIAIVFLFLPLGMAFAFIGVHMAVFGLYMGASFAPNHIGMPILPKDSRVDFLRRQVLTSRNIRGGVWMDIFMGGLNYQIEHHLFPNMPRPHLREARHLVHEYCKERQIKYVEASLSSAYATIIAHLNDVGLAAGDPFKCPVVSRYHHR